MSEFLDKNLQFEDSLHGLTESEINRLIPRDFPGKDFFMKFYMAHNGGYFSNGACFNRKMFYEVSPGDHDTMGVELFYPIVDSSDESLITINIEWKQMKCYFKKYYNGVFEDFVESHVPFAGNGSGDFFWLDMKDGTIKWINHEYDYTTDNIILVAPSFYDFCVNLYPEDD